MFFSWVVQKTNYIENYWPIHFRHPELSPSGKNFVCFRLNRIKRLNLVSARQHLVFFSSVPLKQDLCFLKLGWKTSFSFRRWFSIIFTSDACDLTFLDWDLMLCDCDWCIGMPVKKFIWLRFTRETGVHQFPPNGGVKMQALSRNSRKLVGENIWLHHHIGYSQLEFLEINPA